MVRFVTCVVVALALVGCASNVVTDYNPATTFGDYTTWAYADDAGSNSFMSLDGSRVKSALERELASKAMKPVSAVEAGVLVNWHIVKEERLEQSGLGLGFGFGTGHFGWGLSAPPPVREVDEGKLVIELADAQSRQVIWRAASRRYLNENQSPETRRKLIDEVVQEMFTKYPPELD
jgi:hypothetical protein